MGKKNAKSFDPIFALSKHIADLRADQQFHRGSQRSILEHTPTFLEIYEAWARGETRLTKIPKSKLALPQKLNDLIPKILQKTPVYFVVKEKYFSDAA